MRIDVARNRSATAVFFATCLVACDATDAGNSPETRPSFGGVAGGQSGVEGDFSCEPETEVIALDTMTSGPFTARDVVDRAVGTFESVMSFATVSPAGSTQDDSETLSVHIAFAGEARRFLDCGSRIDIDVNLELHSANGAVELDVPATLSAYSLEQFTIVANVERGRLPRISTPLDEAVSAGMEYEFRLLMTLRGNALSGQLSTISPSSCDVAWWPAQADCEVFETVFSGEDLYEGLRARYVVEAFSEAPATSLRWDDGQETELVFEFEPESHVCILRQSTLCDDNCDGRIRYAVPGIVRMVTDDGRMDVRVPGRVSTTGRADAWRTPWFETRDFGTVGVEGGVVPGLDSGRRAVVNFSTDPVSSLELWAFKPNQGVTAPRGDSCVLRGFLGAVDELPGGTVQGESF